MSSEFSTAKHCELRDRLQRWVAARRTKIQSANLHRTATGFVFVIVQRNIRYDFDLADELTELDLQIINDEVLPMNDVSVQLIPT